VSRAEPPRGKVPSATASLGLCPACGGPLYRWIKAPAADARHPESYVLDRCESCGLGLLHEAGGCVDALLADAEWLPGGALRIEVPNRRSVQAAIGEGRWAALDLPERQLVFTPRALEALLRRGGYRLERVRFPLVSRNQGWMWQTLMNALTLRPNFAREALAGRLRPAGSHGWPAFALDAVVTLLAAPLVALVALPAEAVAALLRRGGLIVATAAPDAAQASSSASPASSSAASS
jgi:hypothetical protein